MDKDTKSREEGKGGEGRRGEEREGEAKTRGCIHTAIDVLQI